MNNEQAPNSLDLEKTIIAGCLTNRDDATDACILLTPEDFYRDSHRIIFRHIKALVNKDNPVEVGTITERIIAANQLETVGGASYISGLLDMLGPGDMSYYCQKVREYSSKRRVLELMNAGMKRAYSDEDVLDTLIYLQGQLDQVNPGVETKQQHAYLDQLIVDANIRYDEIAEGKIIGIKTGYPNLDRKLWGLQPADLIILAARPSMGKTALAMNIAKQTASKGEKVAVFSLEQSKEQLTNRVISSETGINLKKFKHCKFSDDEHGLIADASGKLYSYPLVIDDRPGLNITEIRMAIRKMNSEGKIGCVIIDYLQLINSKDAENRNLQVGAICRELKAIAKEFYPSLTVNLRSGRIPTRDLRCLT
jgi:replicative DNA helicase